MFIKIKLLKNLDLFFLCSITFLLIYNTGFVSDDLYVAFSDKKKWFSLSGLEASPLLHFSHWIAFTDIPLSGFRLAEFLKATYGVFAFVSFFNFFNIFRSRYVALWAAFALVFIPNKDGSTFFFIGQHTMLSLALYLTAATKALQNKKKTAILCSFIGSFISYGSTPIAIGLMLFLVLQKKIQEAICIAFPNIIYVIYYYCITNILHKGINRIQPSLNVEVFLKNLVIQFLSCIDAVLGPSFYIKLIYTIKESGLFGALIGLVIYYIFHQIDVSTKSKLVIATKSVYHRDQDNVTRSLLVMTFLCLVIFAMTGAYPQMAFNLGNRVTLIPTFLLIWLISFKLEKNILFRKVFILLTLICALGISKHWRQFTKKQEQVISNLAKNTDLVNLSDETLIFTKGFRFSTFGPFAHIEGASEDWVARGYLKAATGRFMSVIPISTFLQINANSVVNLKYKTENELSQSLLLVDLDKNTAQRIGKSELLNEINRMQPDYRHWLQYLNNSFIQHLVTVLMPRLKYLL